jgi:pantetheine-phosphate adenylyltransferase
VARFGHAVLGGTFDRLHVGHHALLAAAMAVGRRVSIGVTTPAFLDRHPKPEGRAIQSYETRRRALDRWLSRHYPRSRFELKPLNDPFGRSVDPGVDALVVSAETRRGGAAVNAERRRQGRGAIPIVVVPLVLADDLVPVSSRRIRLGEIDRRGRRTSPIGVGVGFEEAADRRPACDAVRAIFPRARLRAVGFPPPRRGSPAERARRLAIAARDGRELGVGIAMRGARRVVVESTGSVVLAPRIVPDGPARRLRRGLELALSPSRAQRI